MIDVNEKTPSRTVGLLLSEVVSLGTINLFSRPFECFGKSRGAAKCL
jgi:hypothetical protein